MEVYSKFMNETGEHLSNDVLLNYLKMFETLSENEKQFIESHLETCITCKQKIYTQPGIIPEDAAPLSSSVSHDNAINNKLGIYKHFEYWKYAAGIFLFAVVFIIMFYEPDAGKNNVTSYTGRLSDTMDIHLQLNFDSLSQLRKAENDISDKKETTKEPGVAEHFLPNILLENFIFQGGHTSRKINIISPQMEETVSRVITFKWHLNTSLGNLQFSIVDNKNISLYSALVTGSGLTIDKRFKSGLYYWKLESGNVLEAAGKFIVRK